MSTHPEAPRLSLSRGLDVDDIELLALLREHGHDIGQFGHHDAEVSGEPAAAEDCDDDTEMVPLRTGWLCLGVNAQGQVTGEWFSHPLGQRLGSEPFVFADARIEEVPQWLPMRLDVDSRLERWLRILRHPQQESYAVAVYERSAAEPELVLIGTYPDALLCESDPPAIAFVEPHPRIPDRARARLLPITCPPPDGASPTLVEGPAGGVKLLPSSVRRFIKVGSGVRSARVWQLLDTALPEPQLIPLPALTGDPDHLDVAWLDTGPVLLQATNTPGQWQIDAHELREGRAHSPGWQVATGPGAVRHIAGGTGCALVRVSHGGRAGETEHLTLVQLPRTPAPIPLLTSPGVFDLSLNTCAAGVGFTAVELSSGAAPYNWYLDRSGRVLNPAQEREVDVHCARDQVVAADGYACALDLRWRGDPTFHGPVILLVYGAYGIDLDLDSDPDLGHWLDRGYAVATAHVRGGGDALRHRAGARDRRPCSVLDTIAAVTWLREGQGPVRATKLCVIGASAGGFLTASLLAQGTAGVDAAVIVNGYLDPLTALLHHGSHTTQADLDEWGDPKRNLRDREVLERLSPLRHLTAPGPPTLVIVSARDARVDPRLGLAWVLRSRELSGQTTLWYDPDGTHDRWGARMPPTVLIDWVSNALEHTC